ncbi:MAG: hypothetical protein ACI841_001062 [Planctomycetota bacterium]|jgi:hypothetical protein
MAKKKSGAKRHRRSDEELIADLKTRIDELKARQESKKLIDSPAIKATMAAIKEIDKGLEAAAEEGDSHLRHALADARRPLSNHLSSHGVKLPKARLPRGRRPGSAPPAEED